jgi:hypothetical protein
MISSLQFLRLQAQVEALQARVEALESRSDEAPIPPDVLTEAEVRAFTAPQRRGPGRPRKDASPA